MRVSEILAREGIAVPLEAEAFEEAIGFLLQRLEAAGRIPEGQSRILAGEVFSGARGDLTRVNEAVVILGVQFPGVASMVGALGISPSALSVKGWGEGGKARVLLVLVSPRRITPLKLQALPTLARFLRDKENTARLLAAVAPSDVVGFQEFMELEVRDEPLVADALVPTRFRVYPDVSVEEVVGVMVRYRLGAVPVVGEKLDFLGLITAMDVLRHLLAARMAGPEGHAPALSSTARDLMNRSVMGVSEDQALVEAVSLMVNKGISQLPVVREGELVGFLTVESALQALAGGGAEKEGG